MCAQVEESEFVASLKSVMRDLLRRQSGSSEAKARALAERYASQVAISGSFEIQKEPMLNANRVTFTGLICGVQCTISVYD